MCLVRTHRDPAALLGTWPSYHRTLDFALPTLHILASTSLTYANYNCSAHLTFPLFHPDYPANTSAPTDAPRSILLSFKGKSYEDVQHHRTFFRHLDNQRDIIVQYTNSSADADEYTRLLRHSSFCLVPSGRRLGSYRFLESLQHGCIPVITTEKNEPIVLPFSEIIDWSASVIIYLNASISLLPSHLRAIGPEQRHAMQMRCYQLWLTYFSSMQRIVSTALDILHERFFPFSTQSNVRVPTIR